MLITGTGEIFGAVSGGCLEADIVCQAKDVLRSGENSLVIYDVENKDDRVFGFNMGYRGVSRCSKQT